ncbi:class I SAM-dependent methyltransferase [Kineococcus indalonis]|uniref:class I SAM-dependent methyltransferase n=1 Tax=Kineococcus indalonis TaxID=2696566 RepID=UPI0014125DC6|nr:class I SAM-dependent methyltransferase [Kineococcus indalonis]NAZ86273.1 methyltransferase domain-containing protein [Kineococcus indalonis]
MREAVDALPPLTVRLGRLVGTRVVEVATDAWLGARTRGLVRNEGALRRVSVGGDSEYYEAIRLTWWRRIMSTPTVVPRESTFVDLGAGRGRALLLAARRGFREVVGVELDEALAEEARANLRRWSSRRGTRGRAQTLRVVVGDAATFPPPRGPLLVFIANAFGVTTLHHVLTALCSTPRGDEAAFIAYFNPQREHVFADFPRLVVHARGDDWVVYRLVGAPGPGAPGS